MFGILASRFKIVLNWINLCHEKTITIVLACCYLHIFSRHKKVEAYVQDGIDVENMNTGELTNADWRSESMLLNLQLLKKRTTTNIAKQRRNSFVIILILLELSYDKTTCSKLNLNKL